MYCRKEVTFQLTYREDEITMIPKDNCAEIFKEWCDKEADYKKLSYLLNVCCEYGLKKHFNAFIIFFRNQLLDPESIKPFSYFMNYYIQWIEMPVLNGYRRIKMPRAPPPPSSDPTYITASNVEKLPLPAPFKAQGEEVEGKPAEEQVETEDSAPPPLPTRRPPPPPPPQNPGGMKTYPTLEERYTIVKEIGEGSYGKVFLVDGGEMKVLKRYDLQTLTSESKKMISDEIKTIEGLSHPNIIKYEEAFFIPGYLCMILDYCDNGDLSNFIEEKKKKREIMQENDVLAQFRSLLAGTEYIHSKNVIHRDLKPANIFLNHINDCIIGDFGLATQIGPKEAKDKQQGPLGSPRYMAPEILTNKEYSSKSDIWALGCILHELCDYRPAFDGKNYQELVENIRRKPPNRISSLFSEKMQKLIDDMLEKKANARPTCQQLMKRVDKLLSNENDDEVEEEKQPDPSIEIEKEKLVKYPIIKQIGQGAWGKVYLCKDPNGEGNVVLKKMNLRDMDEKQRTMVDNEVKILKDLDSPYIVKYLDGFVNKSSFLCLIMQYCPNGDLEGVIKKQSNQKAYLHETFVLRFWIPIVKAIDYIHDKKIIHRDLKPANVFMGENYRSMLGDFGIAKLGGGSDMSSTVIGTPMYMAPEVFTGVYDTKADVWGLGCILYELASLNPPYKANSIIELNQKIMTGSIPKLPGNFYSRELQNLIDKMLCKNPTGRPSTKQILAEPFIMNAN